MKHVLILTTMLFTLSFANAQKVYSVDRESYADVKVFVVDRESYAGNNDGKWFFVDRSSYAQKKIYFVDRESYADLKIYFVDRESYAGWRNLSKKSVMY